jgi:hypothetical protein
VQIPYDFGHARQLTGLVGNFDLDPAARAVRAHKLYEGSHEVGGGDNAHQLAFGDDRETVEPVLVDHARRVLYGVQRMRRNNLGAHHVPYAHPP